MACSRECFYTSGDLATAIHIAKANACQLGQSRAAYVKSGRACCGAGRNSKRQIHRGSGRSAFARDIAHRCCSPRCPGSRLARSNVAAARPAKCCAQSEPVAAQPSRLGAETDPILGPDIASSSSTAGAITRYVCSGGKRYGILASRSRCGPSQCCDYAFSCLIGHTFGCRACTL